MSWSRGSGAILACVFSSTCCPGPLEAVVISEIFYNPPPGLEHLEFVELASDSSTPEDLSGYSFTEGIVFEFPPGTILPPYGFIVVAADAAALEAHRGISGVFGNFVGRLDASGERLTLSDQVGIPIQSVRYRDEGKWPVAPDGTGQTLSLLDVHLDCGEPESWRASAELFGTPGAANFPTRGPQVVETVVLPGGATWSYQKGTGPFSVPNAAWRDRLFDDSGWARGPVAIGYETGGGPQVLATRLDDMPNAYVTVAIRARFQLTAEQLSAPGNFFLAIDFDDGFCAFVNGSEVARAFCGEPGAFLDWDDIATGSHEAEGEELFTIARESLRAGENVLTISGHNFSIGSSDFSLHPRVLHRREISGASESGAPVFNELFRGAAGPNGWVEIFNPDASPVDLSGLRLTTAPALPAPYRFPPATTIAPGAFLVVTEAQSGLDLSAPAVRLYLLREDGTALAASEFERSPPLGLGPADVSEARFPDGDPLDWLTATPTPGAPNTVARTENIVINELHYHPAEGRTTEFIELYNRGAAAIDISGFSFTNGIDYTFSAGTIVPAGGYVVVARDPARLAAVHGLGGVLGPYAGALANDGENVRLVDTWGNSVDEVRYEDGGKWSPWADGGGSSLELIDPFQDNSVSSAWDASDETSKSEWEVLSFDVADYIPAGQSELHLYLGDGGVCLIDDVSIRRGDGANLIPNPGFESSTSPWLIQGTHHQSRRVTYDSFAGNACLELASTSKGDTLVNRIETDTSPALTRGPYTVSLAARWQRGTNLLIAHGEFTSGVYCCSTGPSTNISGNSLAARLRVTIPEALGTPGAENSVRARLRDETGTGNLGPVISAVEHRPPSPAPGASAILRARVSDSNGVTSVRALWRLGSPAGAFNEVILRDDGLSGDGRAGDGLFGGEIPGVASGSKVVFYLEATDALGAGRSFPVTAPADTLVYEVRVSPSHSLDTYRIVLDDAQTSELTTRPLHSNALVSGSFVFDNERAYYQIGLRYRGSPWGRPGRTNFRLRFPEDDKFHRDREEINLSSRATSGREGAAYFLTGRSGTVSSPAPTAENLYIRTYLNGSSLGTQAAIQTVNGSYMERWYGPDADGPALKAVGRLAFNDAGERDAWDGAHVIHKGTESENYRGYFVHTMNQTEDTWEPLYELTRVLDRRTTSNAEFDAEIESIVDLDAFLRVFAVRVLTADWDAFLVGNGHNGYLAYDARDGRWELLPFDMDNAWGSATPTLFPSGDADMVRFLSRPPVRRAYFRVLEDMVNGYWDRATATPFLTALQAASGIDMGGFLSFLATSNAHVRAQTAPWTTQAFRIVTQGGQDFSIDESSVVLDGEAPVQVATISYRSSRLNDGEFTFLEPTWTSPVAWRAEFPLLAGDNELEFLGFSSHGSLLGSTSLVVTRAPPSTDPRVTAWFPSSGPAEGGTLVFFAGANLPDDVRVFFGSAEGTEVIVDSPESLRATTAPAALPLPPSGAVDIRLLFPDGSDFLIAAGFTYTGLEQIAFVRGDANDDGFIEVSDGLRVLLYLYADAGADCLAALDADGNGSVELTDATTILNHVFLDGAPPAAPYPVCGITGEDCAASNCP